MDALSTWTLPTAQECADILAARAKRLSDLSRDDAGLLATHYRRAPWAFLDDWGLVFEPRNIELGLQTILPFRLWPRQTEYLQWIMESWHKQRRGLVEKSRDCGVTWLSIGFAATMWLFMPGFTCRFGSRKEDLVDRRGDMDTIFEKLWWFLRHIPPIFRPQGFGEACRAHMRVVNPQSGATITGEAGDDIGRGGRTAIAFVDEAAFIAHQDMVDNALSQTTNCQIDISTPNGTGNPFYEKRMRFDGTDRVFVFDWRDDLRKDDAWYAKQKEELDDVTVAQEIDRDYNASAEDQFLPATWVKSAIDAHKKLGFRPEGIRVTGFDPADVGDARAVVNRHGSVVLEVAQRTAGDITQAIPWAFELADLFRADALAYDADGMGAPSMKLANRKLNAGRGQVVAYQGSGAVKNPGKHRRHSSDDEKANIDKYQNYRAQTWSWVRERLRKTHDAVERAGAGQIVNADSAEMISIDSDCGELTALIAELSRPKRIFTPNGKIKVEDKAAMKKRGVRSPNMADALVMAFSVTELEDTTREVETRPPPGGEYSWQSM